MISLQSSSSTAAGDTTNPAIIKAKGVISESEEVLSSSPSSTTTDDHLPEGQEEEEDYLEGQFPGGFGSSSPLMILSSPGGQIMKKSSQITEEEDEEEEAIIATARNYYYGHNSYNHNLYATGISSSSSKRKEEIVEVEGDEVQVQGEGSSLFSFDLSSSFHHRQDQDEDGDGDVVYVAVSSSTTSASMDALAWTLHQASLVNPSSTTVSLVHVFPQIKHIPTPLGMMALSQVNPEQKDKYMAQERDKRREFLNKFISACSTAKVKVDTILIESEMEAQAILDLIPVLNITRLVLGTTKPNLRKMRSKRASAGGSIVDHIIKAAPEFCQVNLICEGKQVHDPFADSPSPRASRAYQNTPRPSSTGNVSSFGCGCFKALVR